MRLKGQAGQSIDADHGTAIHRTSRMMMETTAMNQHTPADERHEDQAVEGVGLEDNSSGDMPETIEAINSLSSS